jgi:hypothetical protein
MKKIVLIIAIVLTTCINSFSQEIGIRLGNISGGNAAVDAVFGTSKFTRIHADVSFGNGVGIDVLWDFLYKPIGSSPINWYLGVGPYAQITDPFYLGVVGEVGLEYRFNKVPIALGVDWRPTFSIIETTNLYADVFGFNARYVFGGKKR